MNPTPRKVAIHFNLVSWGILQVTLLAVCTKSPADGSFFGSNFEEGGAMTGSLKAHQQF